MEEGFGVRKRGAKRRKNEKIHFYSPFCGGEERGIFSSWFLVLGFSFSQQRGFGSWDGDG